jgi:nicotinamide mononucleotide adenylyltransferase
MTMNVPTMTMTMRCSRVKRTQHQVYSENSALVTHINKMKVGELTVNELAFILKHQLFYTRMFDNNEPTLTEKLKDILAKERPSD